MNMKKFTFSLALLIFIFIKLNAQSTISGKVFNDLNNNLIYNTGEELANIKVWLFDYSSVAPFYRVQPIIEVFTDASGNYNFNGLSAGNYQVRVGVSTLPPTLCRAVKDNDSYPNGLTDILGVNGSSNYTQIDFGFASNTIVPSFSSTGSFKWNSTNTFVGGQLSNTYNLSSEICNGITYNPTINWVTNRACTPGASYGYGTEQFPSATNGAILGQNWPGTNKGGINPSDSTFQIIMGGANCYNVINNDRQTTTITFNYAVKNVKFSIYDIDHADPQASSGRIDYVKITGYLGANQVLPVIVNPSAVPWNTISGNTVFGFLDYPLTSYTPVYNSGDDDHSTVNVYFQNTITSIVIDYEEYSPAMLQGKGINDATPPVLATNESSWSDRLPTVRGISIGGIDYSFDCLYFLPVNLTSFSATENNCMTVLKWSASNQINFKQFEIERSSDGINFAIIGTVPVHSFNTEYSFLDQLSGGSKNFYRLRLRDNDGRSSTSQVITISMSCSEKEFLSVTPNPVTKNEMNLQLKGYNKGNYIMQLFNGTMQQVYIIPILINASGQANLKIPALWPKGIYLLLVKDNNGLTKKVEKIIIQ